jgi:predicted AAA+ superfamily ATPase
MSYKRFLSLNNLLEKKSHFLLGPRSTGKSTLIKTELGERSHIIDLLDSRIFLSLSAHPGDLENLIGIQNRPYVVIDEIQKIPDLLNEVHRLIESKKWIFLLTGSSARKLKKCNSNLLAGRAWVANLFPLTTAELGVDFNLEKYLLHGGLPQVYTSQNPEEELNAYVKTYLYEEIRAEALVRKIPEFARFLEMASTTNGQLLNFAGIASDTEVAAATVREYYHVLEDTLMGFMLQPWHYSKKRKAVQTAKFYFFDTGVCHFLKQVRMLNRHSDDYGQAFEQFILMEIRAYLSYARTLQEMTFWRSVNGQEVDCVIGKDVAIEIKAAQKVTPRLLKGLETLSEEKIIKKYYLVSHDPLPQLKNKVHCLPWQVFLQKLWAGEIV